MWGTPRRRRSGRRSPRGPGAPMILEAAAALPRQWHYLERSKEHTHLQDYGVALNPLQNNPNQSSLNQTKLNSFLSSFLTGFSFAFQKKISLFCFCCMVLIRNRFQQMSPLEPQNIDLNIRFFFRLEGELKLQVLPSGR